MGKGKKERNGAQNGAGCQQRNGEAAVTPQEERRERNEVENKGKQIVLRAYMHCQGCADKILYLLKGFEGVEEVTADGKQNKVMVRGAKADPSKVLERLQGKYSRNVELISPKLEPKAQDKTEPEKIQEPQVKMVVLRMNMHCEGCAHDIKKKVFRMEGVLSVEPDITKSQVTVRGAFDPPKLAQNIMKQLGIHVEILRQQNQGATKDDSNNNKKKKKKKNMFHYPPNQNMFILLQYSVMKMFFHVQ
uniref:HMA domain-containing protein n=1 Tax=Salix viminalis TaxID=40686 RepID=A0A6N2LA28_SALVM